MLPCTPLFPLLTAKFDLLKKVCDDRKRRHEPSDMEGQGVGEDGDGGAQRGQETGVQKQPQEEVNDPHATLYPNRSIRRHSRNER